MTDDLTVGPRYVIPARELEWTFGPTGGPGGQHANRSNTRAELRFDLGASDVFPDDLRHLMLSQVTHRGGVVSVVADDSRSQFRNRQIARRRLAERLRASMVRPTERKPTKPSRAQRERRIQEKRRRSDRKRLRRPPDAE